MNRFKSLGSNGSGAFNVPRPIESPDKGCFALLDKLIGIRAQEKAIYSQGPSTRESSAAASSIHSQVGLVVNNNDPAHDSQTIFATQVPFAQEIHPIRRPNGVAQGSNNTGIESSTNPFDTPSQVTEAVGTPANGLAKTVESEKAQNAKVNIKSSINAPDLVRILNKRYEAKSTVTKKLATNNSVEASVFEEDKTAKPFHEQPKGTFIKAVGISVQQHMDQASGIFPSTEREAPMKLPSVNPRLATEPRGSYVHSTDDIFASPKSQGRSPKKRKLNDRISSRDIRISKDQEALLSRADSWLPAEPCQREPQANVPIALLKTFNQNADSRAKRSPKSREVTTDRVATLSNNEVRDTKASASDTESDIASEQWPLSPNRDQLPPDSSPVAINHSEGQSEVLEPCNSPALESPFVYLQANGATRNPLQERVGYGRSERNENTTDQMTRQVPSLSSIIKPSTQRPADRSSQDQTLQFTTGANEFHLPSETNVKSLDGPKNDFQPKDGVLSSEAIHSSASTADSEIEMTIPMPLHKSSQSQVHVAPPESFPSTAAQPKQPSTQVKRTPYPTVNTRDSSNPSFKERSRPDVAREYKASKGLFEERNAQIPSTASTFVSKSDSLSLSSHAVTDKGCTSYKTTLHSPSVEENSTFERSTVGAQTSRVEGEPVLKGMDGDSNLENLQRQELGNPSKPNNKALEGHSPKLSLHETLPAKRVLQADEDSVDGRHNSKRGKKRPSFFYPNRSGRRGEIPRPPALDMSRIPDDLPDPAISARQHREDWFAARRSSESSAARHSPISPLQGHIVSMSSLAGRSTKSNSGLTTPINADGAKMTQEDVFTNTTSTPVVEKDTRPYFANSPQRAAQELLIGMDVASSPKPNSVRMPHTTRESSISSNIEAQGITDAIGVPQYERKSDTRPAFEPTVAQGALQTSSSKVKAPQSSHTNVSAGVATHIVDSSVMFSRPERREAVPARLSSHTNNNVFSTLMPNKAIQVENIPLSQPTFENFKGAYPDYTGDIKHFLTFCRKIEKLWKLNRLHKSMWDDFLIRNKIDYVHHVQQCMEDGDDPMPYDKFYNDKISGPKYEQNFLTPQNLESIIYGSDDGRSVLSRDIGAASTPIKTSSSSMTSVTVTKAQTSMERTRKPAVIIDLTDDDRGDTTTLKKGSSPQSKYPVQLSSRRQVPWTTNSNAQTSSTPGAKLQSRMTQRHPAPPGSQALPWSTNQKNSLGDGRDAAYGRAQSSPGSIKISEVPPTIRLEELFADRKGKGKESWVDTTSSMPMKAPFKNPSADTRLEVQDQGSHPSWWQDEDAPFKTFVRSYLSIRPGNGNAFAKPEDIAWGERKYENEVRKLRHLNVLGWNLDPKQRAGAS